MTEPLHRTKATARAVAKIDEQVKWMLRLAVALGALGLGTLAWGVFQFSSSPKDLSSLGSFLSGTLAPLWSAAGLVLIYVAFLGQKRQIIQQEEAIDLNRIQLNDARSELRTAERIRRDAMDFRISTLAYSTHRELTEWLRHLYGSDEDLIETIRFFGEMAEGPHPDGQRIYRATVKPIMDKWRDSKGTQDKVEAGLKELQTLAPEGSPEKRAALQRTYVQFYDFAGRLNREFKSAATEGEPDPTELALGLRALSVATLALESAIDPVLHDLARSEPLPPSLLDQLATALEQDLSERDPHEAPDT